MSLLDDLHSFDLATGKWTLLSRNVETAVPFPYLDSTITGRYGHGFTSAGGKLYVHGGFKSPAGNNGAFFCVGDTLRVCQGRHERISTVYWCFMMGRIYVEQ